MGKKSGPPPPDYTAAAEKTAASNQAAMTDQTWANRPTQVDPWGRVDWSSQQTVDPATGKPVTAWTQTTSLDPRLQQALDSQIDIQNQRSGMAEGLMGRAASEFGTPMDWGSLGAWGTGPQQQALAQTTYAGSGPAIAGSDQSRQRAEDAIYQSATSRLDPQWQHQQQALETQLAQSGISRNSQAYSRAMDDFNRQRTDAYQQASMGAITGGGTEAQRNQAMDLAGAGYGLQQQQQAFGQQQAVGQQAYGQQLQTAQYQNQMRQAQLAEAMQRRGFSLNEIQALLNGQQVSMPQFQGFNQAGNAGGVDYSGAAGQQFNAAQQQQANSNAATGQIIGGLAGIGGSMLAGPAGSLGAQLGTKLFSDRRTKVCVRRLWRDARGFHVWQFRYIGEAGTRIGVLAQEVRRFVPGAVSCVRGVLRVDYAMLGG